MKNAFYLQSARPVKALLAKAWKPNVPSKSYWVYDNSMMQYYDQLE